VVFIGFSVWSRVISTSSISGLSQGATAMQGSRVLNAAKVLLGHINHPTQRVTPPTPGQAQELVDKHIN